jgi:hypothetical protein
VAQKIIDVDKVLQNLGRLEIMSAFTERSLVEAAFVIKAQRDHLEKTLAELAALKNPPPTPPASSVKVGPWPGSTAETA